MQRAGVLTVVDYVLDGTSSANRRVFLPGKRLRKISEPANVRALPDRDRALRAELSRDELLDHLAGMVGLRPFLGSPSVH